MVIIDASVAFKWFSQDNEEDVDIALDILDSHLHGKELIIVPDLIVYELANAWATKAALPSERCLVLLKDLENSRLKIEATGFRLINRAVAFSKEYNVSVYDAVYAVLAEEKRCIMVTADKKFVEKINLPFVKLLE